MAEIEKNRVKTAFSIHAEQYESLAKVQKRVTDRFFELFLAHGDSPGSLLDVGSGTGRLVALITKELPQVSVTGVDLAFGMISCARKRFAGEDGIRLVCGDAEALPFRAGSFDMVVSTSTYQWLNPQDLSFAEVWRVLKPGGRFCFALFGEKTLYELRDSYRSAIKLLGTHHVDRTHKFTGAVEVERALASASFEDIKLLEELEVETYPDVPSLLRAVNGIGAGSAAGTAAAGLSGRSVMLEMMAIYKERYGRADAVPASYQVLYGSGTKTVAGT